MEDLPHNAVSLIRLEQKLSVCRAVKNYQAFWLGGFLILLANSGESRAVVIGVVAGHDEEDGRPDLLGWSVG